MIDEKVIKSALEEFTENPFWKEVYEAAPTDVSRRWREMEFAHSWLFYCCGKENPDDDYYREQDALEEKMCLEDWEYLYRYSGNNPFKVKSRKMIEALSGNG